MQSRGQYKDYIDIAAILESTEYSLANGLAFARAIYGKEFQPLVSLQALSSFNDLDRPLPDDKARLIVSAVNGVDLNSLPDIESLGPINPVAELSG